MFPSRARRAQFEAGLHLAALRADTRAMSVIARSATAAVVLAVILGVPPVAAAQDAAPPPCPAGVMVTPTFGAADNPESESGSARLYASHPITIAAGFTLEAQADSFAAVWTLPAGLTRASDDLAVSALPSSTPDQASMVGIAAAAGSYTVTVAWTQTDGTRNGPCTGAASTSFDVLAAVAPKLSRPHVTRGLPDESTVALKLAKHGGDLRPLEVRLRWVRAQRFPGAGAKERVLTVPQLRTDPGFDKLTDVHIRAGALRVAVEPVALESLSALSFVFNVQISGARVTSAPFGYDLDVRQGGQTVTRLRVAGRCRRFAGFITCKTKRLSLS
jgi:hypothetical protein